MKASDPVAKRGFVWGYTFSINYFPNICIHSIKTFLNMYAQLAEENVRETMKWYIYEDPFLYGSSLHKNGQDF